MHFLRLFILAGKRWLRTDASRSAAALAYFTPFALVPLILISVSIVGVILDQETFTALLQTWAEMLGVSATEAVTDAVQSFDFASTYYSIPVLGTIFFVSVIVFTFNNLVAGLQLIWGVPSSGIWSWLYSAFRSLLFFILLQIFFVVLFIVEIVLPNIADVSVIVLLQRSLFFIATVALFTFGYGVLSWGAPSLPARLSGAIVVAVVLIFLRYIIDIWIAFTPAVGLYGPAGILFGLLIWIYVTALIIFYGAAFAWAFDHQRIRKRG